MRLVSERLARRNIWHKQTFQKSFFFFFVSRGGFFFFSQNFAFWCATTMRCVRRPPRKTKQTTDVKTSRGNGETFVGDDRDEHGDTLTFSFAFAACAASARSKASAMVTGAISFGYPGVTLSSKPRAPRSSSWNFAMRSDKGISGSSTPSPRGGVLAGSMVSHGRFRPRVRALLPLLAPKRREARPCLSLPPPSLNRGAGDLLQPPPFFFCSHSKLCVSKR